MDKSLNFGTQHIECTLRRRPSICVCMDSPYPGKTCKKCKSRSAARINSRQMALCTRSRIVVCIYNALLPLWGRRGIPDTELLRPTRKLKSRKWILVVTIMNQFNASTPTCKEKTHIVFHLRRSKAFSCLDDIYDCIGLQEVIVGIRIASSVALLHPCYTPQALEIDRKDNNGFLHITLHFAVSSALVHHRM